MDRAAAKVVDLFIPVLALVLLLHLVWTYCNLAPHVSAAPPQPTATPALPTDTPTPIPTDTPAPEPTATPVPDPPRQAVQEVQPAAPLIPIAANSRENKSVPGAECGGALFQFPATGTLGWPYRAPGGGEPGHSPDHTGIDIRGAYGAPIVAVYGGVVTEIGWSSVTIRHDDLGLWTYYTHLSSILVSPGQTVGKGELIGKMGDLGTPGVVHLHFSVKVRNQDERDMVNTTDPSPLFGANLNYDTGARTDQRTVAGWCY